LDGFGDTDSVKELEGEELEEVLSKLKDSIKLDVRQAAVWNALGLMLLKAGCLMVIFFTMLVDYQCDSFCDIVLLCYL